jgi:hypothetical protein
MSFDWIRQTYGIDLRKGQIVRALGKPGVVVKAERLVYVRLDGEEHAFPYHPKDVAPIDAGTAS